MQARYADGRAALMHEAQCEFGPDALSIAVSGAQLTWAYDDLRRADDDNGFIILKRHPDTGERLTLDDGARAELKAAAPALFTAQAHGVERASVVVALSAASLSLAAAFLIGVPMAAEPIAKILPPRYQQQIGEIARSQMEALTEYCEYSDAADLALDDLVIRFVDQSPSTDDDWLREAAHVTVVRAPFPNAFALPDNSIVVTDQLIAAAQSPDEIAGVLAHEVAHITHRHVMANVIRNIGTGVFFDVVFGGAGAGQMVAIASVNLASLRYSRDYEREADAAALDYLDGAGIDPAALARFFDRVAQIAPQTSNVPTLISSHPATAERAAAARQRARPGRGPALTDENWRIVRSACAVSPNANAPLAGKPGAAPPINKGGKPI